MDVGMSFGANSSEDEPLVQHRFGAAVRAEPVSRVNPE
jgi:hypothetical protein